MKPFTALILTEGSNEKGFGHITRCIALYDAIRDAGGGVTLVIDGTEEVQTVLARRPAVLGDWIHDVKFRESLYPDVNCIIVDSYHAPVALYEELTTQATLVICIDDYARIKYPSSSVVLKMEWQPHKKSEPFKILQRQNCPTLWHEVLLRKEFVEAPEFRVNDAIEHVFVSFGATDPQSLTLPVIATLATTYPHYHIYAIIGPGFSHINTKAIMEAGMEQDNISIIKNATATDMKQLMLKSDLAVTAAGQTLNELARIGLPTIATIVADNQELHAQTWHRHGFIEFFDARHGFSDALAAQLNQKIQQLHHRTIREKMSSAGRSVIDGRGAERIVRQIQATI